MSAERSKRYLSEASFLNQLRNAGSRNKKFCFILGSGASVSAGIPTGLMLMEEWGEWLLEMENQQKGYIQEQANRCHISINAWERIQRFLFNGGELSSEDYFDLFDLRYYPNQEDGRDDLRFLINQAKLPENSGYYYLAWLMSKTRHNVVITTNFDDLLYDAFAKKDLPRPTVIGDDSLTKHINTAYPLICKVHGSISYHPKNSKKDTEGLEISWQEKLKGLLENPIPDVSYIPIVIGYGGGDHSLMAFLKTLKLPCIYWCTKDKAREEDDIENFLNGREQRFLIPTNGFDDIMGKICAALMGEAPVVTPAPAPKPEPKREPKPEPKPAPVSAPAPERPRPTGILSKKLLNSRVGIFRLFGLFAIDAPAVTHLVFLDSKTHTVPDNAFDLCENENRAVVGWLEDRTLYIAGKGGIKAPADCSLLFDGWRNLVTVTGAEWFDTSGVTNMNCMFYACSSLQTLNVSQWNTANVTNMNCMFYACSSLQTLNVSQWKTGNVTNMHGMFEFCSKLETLNVSQWKTGNVTNMHGMFHGCSNLETLNVSQWKTGNVTNMHGMFDGCSILETLNVSQWDTAEVTDMNCMFDGCSKLETLNVSQWDTAKVTYMSWMFNGCSKLETLNVSHWNTSNVKSKTDMFRGTRWEHNPPIK